MNEFSAFCSWLCRSKPYDLVHANFFMSGLVGVKLKRQFGTPLVTTFHALGRVRRHHQGEADGFPDERFDIEESIVREADALIAECPQDRDELMRFYSAQSQSVSIIPCGFDPHELSPVNKDIARSRLGISKSEFAVLQLGRLVRRKGIDTAIEGFAAFHRNTGAEARLLVVGGSTDQPDPDGCPEMRRLMDLATALGIRDRVIFAGRKRRSEIRYYYSAADVFVTTPWYEPFGITPVEAMACGTAVVGARVGGIKSTVVDGETGYLVEPKNSLELGEKLEQLYKNRPLCRLFGERGRERAERFYTWNQVALSTERLYESILSVKHRRQSAIVQDLAVRPVHASPKPRLTVVNGGRHHGMR
jgi:glycosyltransferase involved in cell wall biosynthesis